MKNRRLKEYGIWSTMRDRCTNPNSQRYPYYGARGIKVCDRWLHSFPNFIEDMGLRPSDKHSLDRIDNDGDYEPSNCRWATIFEQSQNKRIYSNNKTGYKGICLETSTNKYRVIIHRNKIKYDMGRYRTLEEAIEALNNIPKAKIETTERVIEQVPML